MAHSDTSSPRSLAANLLSRSPPPNIPTSQPHSSTLQSQIKSLPSSLPLTQAALHLANDDLKNCHEIVQNMEGDEMGKLLHQTMHRREGDYWNSNWWIRQISHPLYTRPQLSSLLKSAESVGAEQSKDGEIEKKLWGQIGEMVEWCLENEREGSGKEKKN